MTYKTVFQLAQEKGYEFRFYQTPELVIPEGWELYKTREYSKGKLDVKVRKLYAEDEIIKFNEDGYEYQSIFINKDLSKEDLLLELTLIQKWLRDNYDTHICYMVYPLEVRKMYGKHHHYVYNENWNPRIPSNGFASDDFNISFLQGISEALKLLP